MLTPIQLIAGVWLAAWPAWGGALGHPSAHAAPASGPASVSANHRSPLLSLDDEELLEVIETDPSLLGPLSIGGPGNGRLLNAVAMPEGPRWQIAPNAATWGTSETIDAIRTAIDTVHDLFPDSPPLYIGDISDHDGGRLKRHESHQAGRDADLGFFYANGRGSWFAPGTAANLDLPRNWALVRALVLRADIQTIFLDTRIQKLLYRYAVSLAEDGDWLARIFQCAKGSRDAIVKHIPGHRTHYHVRFYSPVAQELGRRAFPLLVQAQILEPPVYTVRHVARRGQTIGQLAERYGTSVRAIMDANRLATNRLRAGKRYRIPVRAAVAVGQPVVVPRRALPSQTPPALASIEWPSVESLYGETPEQPQQPER